MRLDTEKMSVGDQRKLEEIRASAPSEDKALWLWLRWKCLTDLYFLGAVVLGLERAKDPISGRHRLDPAIHKRMAAELSSDEDALLLYPRLHMKTTWMKYRLIQIILTNPNARIGLWSRTSTLAQKELANIKHLIATPLLLELFAERIPQRKSWEKDTKNELTLVRDPEFGSIPQENQIEIWGIDATVTGHHYDYHFYDDVINEQSVTTPDQIDKVETWWSHVQAIKELTAVEKMIGTRYHQRDIYGKIIAERVFPTVSVHKAIVNNRPFYSFFTMKDLAKLKRRMGEWAFSCQLLNTPVPPSDRIFVPPYSRFTEIPDDPAWYIGVDPATGKRYSNKTGIAIGCVSKNKPSRLFIKEAYGVNVPPNQLADVIVRKIIQYRPKRVGIEYGLQVAIQYLIEAKITEWQNLNGEIIRPLFVPISTGNTKKAVKIANTIGAFIRDNRALLGVACQELEVQMDMYNPNSEDNDDDVLDAARLLIETIEHFAQSHWFKGTESQIPLFNFTMEQIYRNQRLQDQKWGVETYSVV